MATVTVTQDNLESIIEENEIVIIDFWAPWCMPCKMFGPIFEAVSERYPNIVFAKVNTQEETGIADYFGIRSIPTLFVFRERIGVFQQPGMVPEEALDQIITKVQELDMNEVRQKVAEQQKQQEEALKAMEEDENKQS